MCYFRIYVIKVAELARWAGPSSLNNVSYSNFAPYGNIVFPLLVVSYAENLLPEFHLRQPRDKAESISQSQRPLKNRFVPPLKLRLKPSIHSKRVAQASCL